MDDLWLTNQKSNLNTTPIIQEGMLSMICQDSLISSVKL